MEAGNGQRAKRQKAFEARLVTSLRQAGYDVQWRQGELGWEFRAQRAEKQLQIRVIHYEDRKDPRYMQAVVQSVGRGRVAKTWTITHDEDWLTIHVPDEAGEWHTWGQMLRSLLY